MPMTGSRGPERALDTLDACPAGLPDRLGPYPAIRRLAAHCRDQASVGNALAIPAGAIGHGAARGLEAVAAPGPLSLRSVMPETSPAR
ncbi:MAG: hypothetical protein AVDCRST_MAG27-4698 [uncultured Craurococcus sp.]|uniref:Uncharacterized protein n=1 Tax=uncultured Craurococcus sp. TaxID=1135998 RepID=A0A6J4JV89_9PROT|nr:MAG: hypothetical protein AVDCRST_MAG27-4698 [uncultured Craurococcus sp.]